MIGRSCFVEIYFGGAARRVGLLLGGVRVVQERCDCGPQELLHRMGNGGWRIDDVRETILQGLIGGGMTDEKATRLVCTTFDNQPVGQFVPLAQGILAALVIGVEDDQPGELEGEEPAAEADQTSPADA